MKSGRGGKAISLRVERSKRTEYVTIYYIPRDENGRINRSNR